MRRRDGGMDFEAGACCLKKVLPRDICTLLESAEGEAVPTTKMCFWFQGFRNTGKVSAQTLCFGSKTRELTGPVNVSIVVPMELQTHPFVCPVLNI